MSRAWNEDIPKMYHADFVPHGEALKSIKGMIEEARFQTIFSQDELGATPELAVEIYKQNRQKEINDLQRKIETLKREINCVPFFPPASMSAKTRK